jgi:hypothetical protein
MSKGKSVEEHHSPETGMQLKFYNSHRFESLDQK